MEGFHSPIKRWSLIPFSVNPVGLWWLPWTQCEEMTQCDLWGLEKTMQFRFGFLWNPATILGRSQEAHGQSWSWETEVPTQDSHGVPLWQPAPAHAGLPASVRLLQRTQSEAEISHFYPALTKFQTHEQNKWLLLFKLPTSAVALGGKKIPGIIPNDKEAWNIWHFKIRHETSKGMLLYNYAIRN